MKAVITPTEHEKRDSIRAQASYTIETQAGFTPFLQDLAKPEDFEGGTK